MTLLQQCRGWSLQVKVILLLAWQKLANGATGAERRVLKIFLVLYILKYWLLPFVGQKLLNNSKMTAIRAAIISPKARKLKMKLWMQMSGTGPLACVVRLARPSLIYNHRKESMAIGIVERPLRVPANGGSVDIPLTVLPTSEKVMGRLPREGETFHCERFAEFSTSLMLSEETISSSMRCDDVRIQALGGLISISGLHLDTPLTLRGLSGLRDLQITNCRVIGGTVEYMVLQVDCIMHNSSNVSLLDMGDCYFSMSFDPLYVKSRPWALSSFEKVTGRGSASTSDACEDLFRSANSATLANAEAVNCASWNPLPEHVGILPGTLATVLIPDLSVEEGPNAVSTICYFAVPDKDAEPELHEHAHAILSSFLQGEATPGCVLSGHYHHATEVDYLLPSMRALEINATLPGISSASISPMIRSASLKLNMSALTSVLTSLAAPSTMVIYNPLNTEVTISSIKSTIYYQETEVIGTLDVSLLECATDPLLKRPVSLPPPNTDANPHLPGRKTGSPSRFRPESTLEYSKAFMGGFGVSGGKLQRITIPPHASVETPPLPMGLKINLGALMALYDATGGSFEIQAKSELTVTVGSGHCAKSDSRLPSFEGYCIENLSYSQSNIPVTVSLF